MGGVLVNMNVLHPAELVGAWDFFGFNKIEVLKNHVHERRDPKGSTGSSFWWEMILEMREDAHIGVTFEGVAWATPESAENERKLAF
jgi:hypothetical protein